jgi:hypothetical protein
LNYDHQNTVEDFPLGTYKVLYDRHATQTIELSTTPMLTYRPGEMLEIIEIGEHINKSGSTIIRGKVWLGLWISLANTENGHVWVQKYKDMTKPYYSNPMANPLSRPNIEDLEHNTTNSRSDAGKRKRSGKTDSDVNRILSNFEEKSYNKTGGQLDVPNKRGRPKGSKNKTDEQTKKE